MWRRWSFFRQFKLNVIRLVRLRGEPDEVGRGMALGLFIGMTPTFGIQMFIALGLAFWFKQNKIAALIGVWNTNPLTAPIIYGLEYEIGRLIMGRPYPEVAVQFSYEALSGLGWQVLAPLCLGSVVLGVPVAIIGYALTVRFVPSLRQWRVPRWPKRRRDDSH